MAHGGLLVLRHGYLCHEGYFGRAARNSNPDMASTGKAFCSIACGMMLEEFKEQIPEGLDTKVFTETYRSFFAQPHPRDGVFGGPGRVKAMRAVDAVPEVTPIPAAPRVCR